MFDPLDTKHEEAKAIFDQKERVSVYNMSKEEFQGSFKDFKILAEEVIAKDHSSNGLSFPVLLKNGIVVRANKVVNVNIPVQFKNWVYTNTK